MTPEKLAKKSPRKVTSTTNKLEKSTSYYDLYRPKHAESKSEEFESYYDLYRPKKVEQSEPEDSRSYYEKYRPGHKVTHSAPTVGAASTVPPSTVPSSPSTSTQSRVHSVNETIPFYDSKTRLSSPFSFTKSPALRVENSIPSSESPPSTPKGRGMIRATIRTKTLTPARDQPPAYTSTFSAATASTSSVTNSSHASRQDSSPSTPKGRGTITATLRLKKNPARQQSPSEHASTFSVTTSPTASSSYARSRCFSVETSKRPTYEDGDLMTPTRSVINATITARSKPRFFRNKEERELLDAHPLPQIPSPVFHPLPNTFLKDREGGETVMQKGRSQIMQKGKAPAKGRSEDLGREERPKGPRALRD